MSRKILVVDDEKPIADILRFNLEKEDYEVLIAYDGEEAIKKAFDWDPDLILLDIMLPKKDGFQVLKEVREEKDTPVIMLTAKEEEVDKIQGLETGADDYITKPFSIRELSARVKANIRRREMVKSSDEKDPKDIVKSGNLEIDLSKYEVKKDENVIELTLREFELLKFMATKPEQVFSREKLLQEVWGYEYYGDIRTVDVTIRRLREKVEDNSSNPQYVITKRGVGYYFRRA
ncbi:response regulator transcription factor [Clostridium sp. D2Q-14]|uniref:response regulator YycF n=1 Tax=Anaeromonas gelatinilytica TaxID=2683194 RepID=UPI00193BA7FE|nr:response regulator YycF [Anaeromonas gelatinilytica]MBS4534428.1 response regulator transcription factor [Anaeromonas gelatinilytica]